MRLVIAFAALLAAAGPAAAAGLVRCTAPGQDPVTITYDAQRFEGRSMSCVSGSFVDDMTPCAPEGAFALSAPTGAADVVEIVDRWQAYAKHFGGVASFFRTKEEIAFAGGFNDPDSGFTESWRFSVDRVTGEAKLKRRGKPDIVFACRRARAKL